MRPASAPGLRPARVGLLAWTAAFLLTSCGAVPATPVVPPAAANRFLHGFHLGVVVQPGLLLPGLALKPTGESLVRLLAADHLRTVRLLASGEPPRVLAALHQGGWHTVFVELKAAHVQAILLLDGQRRPDGRFVRGVVSSHGLIRRPSVYIADEEAMLADIRRQEGGHLPVSLAAVDVGNEPLVDSANLPALTALVRAIRADLHGRPVTIGGWHTPGGYHGQGVFNQPQVTSRVAPLEDFVSVHLYPDGLLTTANTTSTRPATYLPYARRYLETVLAESGNKPVFVEEFGGQNGLAPASNRRLVGSPAHQQAVVEAVLQAMAALRSRGILGGTAWVVEPYQYGNHAVLCDRWSLICFEPARVLPALGSLAAYARAYHGNPPGGG